ncbi:polysaccharide deacetylase family protein [Herpetosiphon giganteus]|uniref:polysaccharide deacetylase family protein n=1 Tax=Herpetosiphon giganteus TaxID=2029754 RepID=UPI001EF892A9|nr:polysaccharide deacetylase family protein [Herpetosiphon giganteus]
MQSTSSDYSRKRHACRQSLVLIGLLWLLIGCGSNAPTPRPTITWRLAQPVAATITIGPTYTPQASEVPPMQPTHVSDKVLYLTFDDGPDPTWTPKILALLAQHHTQATFFVLGRNAQTYPEIIEQQRLAGHLLANHSWSHPDLTQLDQASVFHELSATQALLGATASSCFRPPYGKHNQQTTASADQLGLRMVLWDVDSADWKQPGTEEIVARIRSQVRDGAVVLLHDGGGSRQQTIEALEILLPELAAQGYRFVAACS